MFNVSKKQKDKTPEEAVLAKLGRKPVVSKDMEQELIGQAYLRMIERI